MSSEPIRDPLKDDLLTPQNSAFIVIDYQPVQVNSIASMERQRLVSNIVRASKAAVLYGLPIVHSTVNVKTGDNKPPIAPLRKVLEATGRKKLIMTALWTEACLTFPALDAMRAGFQCCSRNEAHMHLGPPSTDPGGALAAVA
jgi:nicotinamidase-related amidase